MIDRVPPRLKRSWAQRGVIMMNLSLIVLALGAAALLNYGYDRAASINRVSLGRSLTVVPEELEPGERVMNVLLVGSDSSATLDEDDPIQIGRQGERFGDVIIIAHIDERTSDIALLSLPRDLWVDIAGNNRPSRINRAFEIGGPVTLIETIEEEFDIPIHHYVNVDFAGFQGLVEAVGSVDVFFETPARDWNVAARPEPRSQTGFIVETAGCHSLDSETALAYVRSRFYQTQNTDGEWVTDPTSDLGRIRRQQDFLRRLLQQAISLGARNPFVLSDLIDAGLENVAIDQRLTPQLLVDLGATYRSFDPVSLQTYSFPAVDGQVGQNQVLLPLRDDAEPVLALFAGAEFDDPTTVGLAVQVGPESDADTASAVARLRLAGFDVDPTTRTDLPTGTIVRHGPDGRHAAELVVEALGQPATIEQVGGLSGRSVLLLLGEEVDDSELQAVTESDDQVPSDGNETATGQPPDPVGPAIDSSPDEIVPIPDGETRPPETEVESHAGQCG